MDNVSLSPDVRSFLQNQVIDAEIKKGLEDIKAGNLCDGIDFMNEVIAHLV